MSTRSVVMLYLAMQRNSFDSLHCSQALSPLCSVCIFDWKGLVLRHSVASSISLVLLFGLLDRGQPNHLPFYLDRG